MSATLSPAHSNALSTLAFSRHVFSKVLDGVPAEHLMHQLADGCGHPLWQAGHIAWTDDSFLATITGNERTMSAEWTALFEAGSEPGPDASRYPSMDEVRAALTERREALESYIRGLSDDQLAEELPENIRMFGPTYGAFCGAVASHESMHAGQVMLTRRALKLGPVLRG